jgi:GT2 family glycosyltransferase
MVSAIVLSYNRCADVLFTISKLKDLKTSLPFDLRIIVVDNASTDDTSARIGQEHADITLITKQVNNGIAGWNDGLAVADTKYNLVLDDDSHIESGLKEAIEYLEENDQVGILALNISGGTYATHNWIDKAESIGFIGCGAIIKKEVYDRIGGFSEWLYVSGHEWEYGIRCIDANYKIIFFKKSDVVHRSNVNDKRSKRTIMYTTRNEMGIVFKYFRSNRSKLLLRVLLNNIKLAKTEGLLSGYYSVLGGLAFLKLRKKLAYTPVSQQTQDFFSSIFWSTQPTFDFIRKRFNRLINNK